MECESPPSSFMSRHNEEEQVMPRRKVFSYNMQILTNLVHIYSTETSVVYTQVGFTITNVRSKSGLGGALECSGDIRFDNSVGSWQCVKSSTELISHEHCMYCRCYRMPGTRSCQLCGLCHLQHRTLS